MKESFRKKIYFKRFLISYFILLFIPFVTILFTYYIANKTIKEEILTSNKNNLHLFFSSLDSKFEDMTFKSFQILQSEGVNFQSYETSLSPQKLGYIHYNMKKYLSEFRHYEYSDILVYLKDQNRIVSAVNSSLIDYQYYQTYYSGRLYGEGWREIDFEKFQSNLAVTKNSTVISSLGEYNRVPLLAITTSQNLTNSFSDNVSVTIVLRPETTQRLILNANIYNKAHIMLYDGHGNKILYSDGAEELLLDISPYTEKNHLYSTLIDGVEYIVQIYPSEILKCTYVSLVAINIFWQKLYSLRAICVVSTIFALIISGIMSWIFASRSYSPITNVLKMINSKRNIPFDGNDKNELEFIEEVLKNSFDDNELLSFRIKDKKNSLRDDFLIKALQGSAHVDDTDNPFSDNGINLLSNFFAVIIIKVENNLDNTANADSYMQRHIFFIVANIFTELWAGKHQCFVSEISPLMMVGTVNFALEFDEEVCCTDSKTICTEFKAFVKKYFDMDCTISISGRHEGLIGIRNAYVQAQSTLAYRFIKGRGSIIEYAETVEKHFRFNASFDSHPAGILIKYVKEDTDSSLPEILREITDEFSLDSNSHIEAAECFRYDMIIIVNKIINDIGAGSLDKGEQYVKGLIAAETMEDFKQLLISTLQNLRTYWQSTRERHNICDKAYELITKEYTNPNLNNNTIGDMLSISSSYLSRLFKNQHGFGLMDFLYKTRIDKSKELLRQTGTTVEEIAIETGFINGSAFIKIFKKYEGITPGVYRKLFSKSS